MPQPSVYISISNQTLEWRHGNQSIVYPISSALNGIGQDSGSGCTPLGEHVVRAKIGANLPLNAVLIGRRWTGERLDTNLYQEAPERDWILSRILWLSGTQVGFNRLGNVDTMRRYIYIHGTPDQEPMGIPKSHGCIRMRNLDVVDLFDRVQSGTHVLINH